MRGVYSVILRVLHIFWKHLMFSITVVAVNYLPFLVVQSIYMHFLAV